MEKLTQEQVDAQLADYPEWSQSGDSLQRTVRFDQFTEAMAFANKVADLAERMQHHPDIMIRYNKVTVALSTHDAGGITGKDFEFAGATDRMVAEPVNAGSVGGSRKRGG